MKRIVEICTGSYGDCLAAFRGGAGRVELNSALSVGGLTPSVSTLRRVKKETDLKVICMVRPRAAGFCYDETETAVMLEDAALLLSEGADGIAFGFLKEDKTIDVPRTKKMTELIHGYGKEAVFHRAFDVVKDVDEAMEALIMCGIDRILSSGQKRTAPEGTKMLGYLQRTYGGKMEILAGSGVNGKNAAELMERTGIWQVHSSCKGYRRDKTTIGADVSYAYLEKPNEEAYDVVEEEKVREIVKAVCGK